MKKIYPFLTPLVLGLIIGSLATYTYGTFEKPTIGERVAEYYVVENLVRVSPHTLRTAMDEGTSHQWVIVDLRSSAEYEQEHIISAINIPGFADPATDEERIITTFKKIVNENPDKQIVTYCYSSACTLAPKVGQLLSEHGIFVKHLNIGWNEWRNDWQMWNSISEDPQTVHKYIHTGKEPGTPQVSELISPCSDGKLGC